MTHAQILTNGLFDTDEHAEAFLAQSNAKQYAWLCTKMSRIEAILSHDFIFYAAVDMVARKKVGGPNNP